MYSALADHIRFGADRIAARTKTKTKNPEHDCPPHSHQPTRRHDAIISYPITFPAAVVPRLATV